jgi:hypothetical protein
LSQRAIDRAGVELARIDAAKRSRSIRALEKRMYGPQQQ